MRGARPPGPRKPTLFLKNLLKPENRYRNCDDGGRLGLMVATPSTFITDIKLVDRRHGGQLRFLALSDPELIRNSNEADPSKDTRRIFATGLAQTVN